MSPALRWEKRWVDLRLIPLLHARLSQYIPGSDICRWAGQKIPQSFRVRLCQSVFVLWAAVIYFQALCFIAFTQVSTFHNFNGVPLGSTWWLWLNVHLDARCLYNPVTGWNDALTIIKRAEIRNVITLDTKRWLNLVKVFICIFVSPQAKCVSGHCSGWGLQWDNSVS